jgi:hypothetical protein
MNAIRDLINRRIDKRKKQIENMPEIVEFRAQYAANHPMAKGMAKNQARIQVLENKAKEAKEALEKAQRDYYDALKISLNEPALEACAYYNSSFIPSKEKEVRDMIEREAYKALEQHAPEQYAGLKHLSDLRHALTDKLILVTSNTELRAFVARINEGLGLEEPFGDLLD